MLLNSFPSGFRVCIIGASGALGHAFVEQLKRLPHCGEVIALHRQSEPSLDLAKPDSIAAAAESLRALAPFHLIIHAAGILHQETFMPEKKLNDLNWEQMQTTFAVNTLGPALVLRHFAPLLDRERAVFAFLSAKVGSIEDNRLGGWYSYRASKAALNMMIKTASIELKRTQANTVLLALHPGTVQSKLSQPFRGAELGRPPSVAAQELLTVMDTATPKDSGKFLSYQAENLPW